MAIPITYEPPCTLCGQIRDIVQSGEFAGFCRPCKKVAVSSRHDNPALERVRGYISKLNHRPTVRDVAASCGISSTSVASYYLSRAGLEKWKPKYENKYGTSLTRLREEIIILMGGKCTGCGYDEDVRALQIDHKNSNGSVERRELGQRGMFEKMFREAEAGNDSNYQVLCCNCNWIKRYEKGEWNRGRINK